MTFAEWWKSIEGWKTEGGSGENKARAAWDHQQKKVNRLKDGYRKILEMPKPQATQSMAESMRRIARETIGKPIDPAAK